MMQKEVDDRYKSCRFYSPKNVSLSNLIPAVYFLSNHGGILMKLEIGKAYQYSPWYSHGTNPRNHEDTICRVCNKIYNMCCNQNEIKFQICPVCSWRFYHWLWNQEFNDNLKITKTRWTKTNVSLFLLAWQQDKCVENPEECISHE